jgi:Raf kinase inhibitor-like YbhB/YbcL family protein
LIKIFRISIDSLANSRLIDEMSISGKQSLLFACVVINVFTAWAMQAQGGSSDMELTSPEFKHNQSIPSKFTCEGRDISPGLQIEGLPEETKSLTLIVDDPDAPVGVWVHWVVFDIPVLDRIEEGAVPGKQGLNTAGGRDYHGPCPPSGTHRYFFKLYALDTLLNLEEGASKGRLEKAMQGHILAKAELVGLYKKKK